jgi:hypothetical protein
MALLKLFYHDDYVNNYDGQLLPSERTGEPFFDLDKNQNIVWVNELKFSLLNVQKTYTFLHTFVNGLNGHLSQFEAKAKFTLEFGEGGVPIKCTLVYAPDYGNHLFLDDNLNDYLGFTRNDFESGTYVSDKPLNIDGFNKLPTTFNFRIERRRWGLHKVLIDQLYDPTLDDIAISISGACAKSGFRIQVLVDEEANTLTINTFSETIFVSLSSFLNQYLKLPWKTEFRISTTVSVPRYVINPFAPFAKYYLSETKSEKLFSPNKIFVTSTLSKQHYFERLPIPLLQVINRIPGRQELVYVANPPIYTPICDFENSTINIQLLDDNLNNLPVREEATICVLHFKRKWI